ncbi:MAG: hypothetical protein NTV01_17250 [Bacteroidia bacterium]|nr:hypothetical protein [Bacteroidia bacterium]
MLSIEECKKILNSESRSYYDEEVQLISQFLWKLAQKEVDQFINRKKDENSSSDVTGKL